MAKATQTSKKTATATKTARKVPLAAEQMLLTLGRDNKSVLLLMEILEQQQDMLDGKRIPDYIALSSIVDFVANYHSTIQQPREELVFRALELRSNDAYIKRQIDEQRAENEELKREFEIIGTQLAEISAGEKRADKKLLREGLEGVLQLARRHMHTLQMNVLPEASDSLRASDWKDMQMKVQYLEQEEEVNRNANEADSDSSVIENVQEGIDEAAAAVSVLQVFGAYAMIESTVAWVRGTSNLRRIAFNVLRGDTDQLEQIGPVIRKTAKDIVQPYKNRVRVMKSLFNQVTSS